MKRARETGAVYIFFQVCPRHTGCPPGGNHGNSNSKAFAGGHCTGKFTKTGAGEVGVLVRPPVLRLAQGFECQQGKRFVSSLLVAPSMLPLCVL